MKIKTPSKQTQRIQFKRIEQQRKNQLAFTQLDQLRALNTDIFDAQQRVVKHAKSIQFGNSTDPDHQRYMDILKGKARKDLSDFMLPPDADITDSSVDVPIQPIELPRFTRGSNEDDTGQGDGEEGDEVGEVGEDGEPQAGEGQPQEGPGGENQAKAQPGEGEPGEGQAEGPGEPGDEVGEPGEGEEPGEGDQAGEGEGDLTLDDFRISFSRQDIYKMIDNEDLELPNFEERGGSNIQKILYRFRTMSKFGPQGLTNLTKTMQEYLKRSMPLLAEQLEKDGEISDLTKAPIDVSDMRFKAAKEVQIPKEQAVIFYVIDTSGSMNEERKKLARNTNFFLSTYIQGKYGEINAELRGDIAGEDDFGEGVEEVFITHDTEAQEINEKQFYTESTRGGTAFAPAYEMIEEIVDEKYPLDQWNVYIVHYTDGDNYNNTGKGGDNDRALGALNRMMEKGLNMLAYIQVDKSRGGPGQGADNKFKPVLDRAYGQNHSHIRTAEITEVKDSEFKRVVGEVLGVRDD